MNKPVLALFGGAFDPYTRCHDAIVNNLLDNNIAAKVLVVPAQAHRSKNCMAPLEHRLGMLSKKVPLIDDEKDLQHYTAAVMDINADVGQPEKSWGSTWNLANLVEKKFPDYKVMLVIGADNAMNIQHFYNAKKLLGKFEFICIARGEGTEYVPKGMRGIAVAVDLPGSSTDARKLLYKQDWSGAEEYLFGSTIHYARENNVYRLVTGGPDLREDGENYDRSAYAKAANTVDIAIVRLNGESLEVLLINRKWNPFQGMWAIPGGFVDIAKAEGLDKAALRELEEETNVKGIPVRQLATYGDPDRDKRDRVISTVYYALLPQGGMDEQKLQAMDDAGSYQWRVLDEEMDISDIAFDHAKILMNLLGTLRELSKYTPLPFQLLPPQFTWKQAQEAYTALLGHPLLNIRRKLGHRYMIESVGERVKGMPNRPAGLFQYQGEKDGL
jgi:8-oxo-dGTP diphosphatase